MSVRVMNRILWATRLFSWGDNIEKNQANCSVCGSRWESRSTAPVVSFDENSFGLFDVHGNVREWVADCWHQNCDGAPTDGSAWVVDCASPIRQVVRGGDRDNSPELLLLPAAASWRLIAGSNLQVFVLPGHCPRPKYKNELKRYT